MRKFLIISLSCFSVAVLTALVFAYFYGRRHLEQIAPLIAHTLRKQDVEFTYGSIEVPATGLSLELVGLSIRGPKLLT